MSNNIRYIELENNEKVEALTTSIIITKEHKKFIDKKIDNFSLLVRKILDDLIRDDLEKSAQDAQSFLLPTFKIK